MADHMQAQLQAYIESALPQWPAPRVGPVGRISDGWESELFTLDVEHGPGWLSRALIRLMKLPDAGGRQPVELDVAARGAELVWSRRIGRIVLRTRQRASGSRLVERAGLGRVFFDLSVDDGALLYRQASLHVAGLPLPCSLSPRVSAIVSAAVEGWHVDVTVRWRDRVVCRYAGSVRAS